MKRMCIRQQMNDGRMDYWDYTLYLYEALSF